MAIIVEYHIPETLSFEDEFLKIKDYSEIISCDLKDRIIRVAFQEDCFEPGNLLQHLSLMKIPLAQNEIMSISWSNSMIKSFRGPSKGISGFEKIQALPATLVELSPDKTLKEQLEEEYHLRKGGIDFIMDPEEITHLQRNSFEDRLECFEKNALSYIPNITSRNLFELERRMDKAYDHGVKIVRVNLEESGLLGISTIRELCFERGMRFFGNSFVMKFSNLLIQKPFSSFILRLLGVDGLMIDPPLSPVLLDLLKGNQLTSIPEVLPILNIKNLEEIPEIFSFRDQDIIIHSQTPFLDPDGLKSGAEKFSRSM